MATRKAKRKPQGRPLLSPEMRSRVLGYILRRYDLFLQAKDLLTIHHFDTEPELAALWSIVLDYHEQHNRLPGEEILLVELFERRRDSLTLPASAIQRAVDMLAHVFALDESKIDVAWAAARLQHLLYDHLATETTRAITTLYGVPTDGAGWAEKIYSQSQLIAGVTTGTPPSIFGSEDENDTSWMVQPKIIEPTGVGFVDHYLDGGPARGEVHLVLGPTGSCKTRLVTQLVETEIRAMAAQARAQPDAPPGVSVYAHYELKGPEVMQRFLSCAASVPLKTLERASSLGCYSTSQSLKDYERTLFQREISAGLPVLGEQERLKAAREILRRHLVTFDMTGSDNLSVGTRGHDELIGRVRSYFKAHPTFRPATIVVDYIGAMVERQINAEGRDDRDRRNLVGRMPLHLRNLMAVPLDCKVWVLQQVASAQSSMPVTTLPKRSDAADAKNLADNCDSCLVLSNPNAQNLCLIANDKPRRTGRYEPKILHIHPVYSWVEDVSEQYQTEARSKSILSKEEARMLGEVDPEEAEAPRSPVHFRRESTDGF